MRNMLKYNKTMSSSFWKGAGT